MAVTCTAAALTAAAVDYDRCSDRELQLIQVYELGQIANGLTGLAVDAKSLEAGAVAYARMSDQMLQQAKVYLLCQIASASGA